MWVACVRHIPQELFPVMQIHGLRMVFNEVHVTAVVIGEALVVDHGTIECADDRSFAALVPILRIFKTPTVNNFREAASDAGDVA